MRPSLVACVALCLAFEAAVAAQARRSGDPRLSDAFVAADRIPRLERWLIAVDRHQPGDSDAAVDEVGSWGLNELRGLWVDVNALAQLMRNANMSHFVVRGEGQAWASQIRYSNLQLRQLLTLACAAGAMIFSNPACVTIKAASSMNGDLLRLASHVDADRSRTGGEDNYVLRRGALLHGDIAMLQGNASVLPFSSAPANLVGPQSWRVDISDGRGTDVGLTSIHWDIARLALDQVRPAHVDRPAPGRDPMVRNWYIATSAWMQFRENHDTLHLDRGRALFPDDPDLQFLSGCQRETYASPAIQAAARSVSLPSGLTVGVDADRSELQRAEGFFRRALAVKPHMGEAHLRLGRVLGLLGRHVDALAEMKAAEPLFNDEQLQYYAALFIGAEEEALGHFDAARDKYQRAAVLFPLAQSPLLALSQLAHRRGDRAGAAAALQKVFALPAALDRERDDPWWRYHVAQARNADDLMEAVTAPFRREREQ